MNIPRTTKGRLLSAACSIFAEKGFREATVAEICEAAEANIAAVNYHFGDKSNLYFECFRHLFRVADQAHPAPDVQSTDTDSWLRSFIRSRISNILDDGEPGLLPKLMHKEMGQPTELHNRIRQELIQPRLATVNNKVRDFLGSSASDDVVRLATINFCSIYIFINFGKQQSHESKPPQSTPPWGGMTDNELAAQVEHFAMGGLRATRDFLQSRTGNP